MKRLIGLFCIVSLTILLSSCGSDDVEITEKYCLENPRNQECIDAGYPKDDDPLICDIGTHEDNGECVDDPLVCETGSQEIDGVCVEDPLVCETGTHVENDTCVDDPLVCETGTHEENGACVDDPLVCETGTHEENGACVDDPLVCETGTHEENGACVDDPLVCSTGFHEENGACVEDPLVCEAGYHVEGDICEIDVVLQCPLNWKYEAGLCVRVVQHLECADGFHEEYGSCVEDTLTCDDGYHEKSGQCILNDAICTSEYCYYESQCWNSCELPIDHPNYSPCYTECYDDLCNYYHYELSSANSTFESLEIWIDFTMGAGSFEMHYVLSGETKIIVETGPIQQWDVDKLLLRGSRATVVTPHNWNFEIDDNWNLTLIDVSHIIINDENEEEVVYDNFQIFSVSAVSE